MNAGPAVVGCPTTIFDVGEWRDRVLDRLLAAMDSYERGATGLPMLQFEIDAAAAVLESPDADATAALRQAEADLESIRFTVASDEQRQAVTALLAPLRERLRYAPDR